MRNRICAGRCAFLLLICALLDGTAAAHTAERREWSFDVLLNDKPIGRQTFRLSPDGDGQRVSVEADFDVRILFLRVYSYSHHNDELWRDGCLFRIDSATDENGTPFRVRGKRQASGFAVETATSSAVFDDCVWTFAYWDESFLSKSRLLNSQTGTYERVRATLIGTEEIAVNGRPTEARRYALEGASFRIDLWYSLDGDWLALESRTGGGSLLRFSRTLGAAGLHSTSLAR